MYIDRVPNRTSPPSVLLRRNDREGKSSVKTTIANLTACPPDAVKAFELALKGVKLVPVADIYTVVETVPHGHVEAILGVMRSLGIDKLLSASPCRERNLIMAMIVQRLIDASSKLATTRLWHATTLAEELNVQDADENDLYNALDWLLARQARIETKLAHRHLKEESRVLYDVSSSSYTGQCCPLAVLGYNRDKKKLPSIVYGLLTDSVGRPIAVEVYKGNTGDPDTVPDQVVKLRKRFGLQRVVLVGDRGMLTDVQIATLKKYPHMGWISALRTTGIQKLVEQGDLQLSLFDKVNLLEIHSAAYPNERLMVCYNPLLDGKRKHKRASLIEATTKCLNGIIAEVSRRTKKPLLAKEIGLKVGRVLHKYKMGKHFALTIEDNHFAFSLREDRIEEEARIDGIYIVRTSETKEERSTEDTVRAYKSLGQVEQAFRCLKGVDILIRPMFHRTEQHVRAHIFLCMLTYYVEWHMKKMLASVLFNDEELDDLRWTRDPVAKAEPSRSAKKKKATGKTPDGHTVHSFKTLMPELGKRGKNLCRVDVINTSMHFTTKTEPTAFQRHVFNLLGLKCETH